MGQRPAGRGGLRVVATDESAPELPLLRGVDRRAVAAELDQTGFALTPPLLDLDQCATMRELFERHEPFRTGSGTGSHRYFAEPLQPLVRALRCQLYPALAWVANRWAERLGEPLFPAELSGLAEQCAAHGQHLPASLLRRHDTGGSDPLHQDLYGDLVFPLEVAVMLSAPDMDFTGGEIVLVENRPGRRATANVVRPDRGQGVVFPVRHRPEQGARGERRVEVRHGVSTVHAGHRHELGVIFHNAA